MAADPQHPSPPLDRERHRRILAAARRDATEQLAARARDFDAYVEGAELVNTDDEHDPEGATIAFERAQVIALRDDARRRVLLLDRALASLDEGTYGRCAGCGGEIGAERLVALPGIDVCLACAARGTRADGAR